MKKWLAALGALALLIAGLGFLGYQQGWIAPPVRDLRTLFYLPGKGRFLRAVDGVSLTVKPGDLAHGMAHRASHRECDGTRAA